MKLLANGFAVTESTFAGSTAGSGGASSAGASFGPGKGFHVQKIVAACGGSTVAANSSGGIQFVYGDSSGSPASTIVVLPTPKSADASSGGSAAFGQVELCDLNIYCNWFEARSNEAAVGGWAIWVFGD